MEPKYLTFCFADINNEIFNMMQNKSYGKLTLEEKVLKTLHIVRCQEFTEYDPGQNAIMCTRFFSFNMAFFDLDEECECTHEYDSSIPCQYYRSVRIGFDFVIMHGLHLFTAKLGRGPQLHQIPSPQCKLTEEYSVNVISLKIRQSDVGFPINLFGTVIARDEVDYKCVYLFRREMDDSQVITSQVSIGFLISLNHILNK